MNICRPVLPNLDHIDLAPNTETMEIYVKTTEILEKFPEISAAIQNDLDQKGLVKKSVRDAQKRYELEQTSVLPGMDVVARVPVEPKLEGGRPRMPVGLVLFFMFLRGKWNSISDHEASERMIDSISVQSILSDMGLKNPGANTLRENVNAINNTTRFLILKAEGMMILEKGLDDFHTVLIDSTAVKGNTAWPTDITILFKLLDRLLRCFRKLSELGLPEFDDGWTSERLRRIEIYLKFINMQAGKQGIKGKVKTKYRQLLRLAQNMIDHYISEQEQFTPYWEKADLAPVDSLVLDALWGKIEDDISDALYVLHYADLRIEQDVKLPSTEKILSISDRCAAYIQKGQRNAVIGYKPQIARSGNGFVCGVIVPEGNAADSNMLKPVLKQVFSVTGVVPSTVSADDGYASAKNVEDLFGAGVMTVSISGSKGKKVLPDELWNCENYIEARNKRSAVESGMFTLKFNHGFGQLRRRGVDRVRAELLEKVLSYNLLLIIKKEKEVRHELKKVG